MKIGDLVKVNKCDQCPGVVGKVVSVSKVNVVDGNVVSIGLNFGKGRPQRNRPDSFSPSDVSIVEV